MDGLSCYESSKSQWLRAIGSTHKMSATWEGDVLWPPKHHPTGDYFLDMVFYKIFFYLISILSVLALCVLRYPEVFYQNNPAVLGSEPGTEHLPLPILYIMASVVVAAINATWILWFASATINTGRALRQQSYMATRSQQLSYRFYVQQVILVVVCFGASLYFQVWQLLSALRRRGGSWQKLWLTELQLDTLQVPFWAGSFQMTGGELFFVSMCCYAMAFIFLPAKRWTGHDVGGGGHPHVCMEAELDKLRKKKR